MMKNGLALPQNRVIVVHPLRFRLTHDVHGQDFGDLTKPDNEPRASARAAWGIEPRQDDTIFCENP